MTYCHQYCVLKMYLRHHVCTCKHTLISVKLFETEKSKQLLVDRLPCPFCSNNIFGQHEINSTNPSQPIIKNKSEILTINERLSQLYRPRPAKRKRGEICICVYQFYIVSMDVAGCSQGGFSLAYKVGWKECRAGAGHPYKASTVKKIQFPVNFKCLDLRKRLV